MTLSIEASLRAAADALRDRIAPALDDPFAIEAARLAGQLLAIAANAVDDAAALRVAENAAIRALFADAVSDDAGLSNRLAAAAAAHDPGLRLSELDAENARLRLLLVDLHVHVETRADEAARATDARIWRLLKAIEANRAPRL